MKKLAACLLLMAGYLSLSFPVSAQNKLGVNIGARYGKPFEEFNQAAELVGPGGWVVVMASPGNAPELKKMFSSHPEVNIILRGHCPSDPLGPDDEKNRQLALAWTATLGGIGTAGRKIYFMPWNEPNMTRECAGVGNDFDPNNTDCAPHVVRYIQNLSQYLSQAGLLGTKIELISPMINQHHANYSNFIKALGGRSFFSQFSGIAMNLYDHQGCGADYCSAGRYQEVLARVGLGGMKVFAVETGIIAPSGSCPPGVTDCPIFEDGRMDALIEKFYPQWESDPNFVMFSPLSYNPETNVPSWIWGGRTSNYYHSRPKSGRPPATAGFDLNKFINWRNGQPVNECPAGMEGAFTPPALGCNKCGPGALNLEGEKEVIVPKNDYICTDFDLLYHQEQTSSLLPITPTPASVLGTSQETVIEPLNGELSLKKINLPNFSLMEQSFNSAISKLLPYQTVKNISIDKTPLTTRFKHFIFGEELAEKIPQTEALLPSWWTGLLGETKILCGLFNTCQAPKSGNIEIKQPETSDLSKTLSYLRPCWQTKIVEPTSLEDISDINSNFTVSASIEKTSTTKEEIRNGVLTTTLTIAEDATLKNKTRGWLVGGKTLGKQIDFALSNIPKENQLEKNSLPAPLAAKAGYSISENYILDGPPETKKLNYWQLNKVRADYCLFLCSLYPDKTDLKSVDPICISCNPEDYLPPKMPSAPFTGCASARVGDYQPGSYLDENGNLKAKCCDYGVSEGSISKPNNPYYIRITDPKCYTSCHKEHFYEESVPYGGECFYCNADVCVRNDGQGGCAGICNWQCCTGQE